MTHSVPRILSPSSFKITRSTPCVEGCCGPMFRTSSVESRKVASGILLPALNPQVLLDPDLVLLQDRVVLAERVTPPSIRHEDAAHVGVTGELDAEHVEHFALQPVGRQVHVNGGGGLEAVGDSDLEADPLIVREAVQDVDEIET